MSSLCSDSVNDLKFFNSFSYARMQYGGNLCILWPLRLHWNCYFDHWKFSTMGLLLFLLPTTNTICIYWHHCYTRVSLTNQGPYSIPTVPRLRSKFEPTSSKMTTHFSIICTCISLMKAFALPKYRHLRGILFLVFGMCGIAPCVHSTFFHGVEYSFSKEMFYQEIADRPTVWTV